MDVTKSSGSSGARRGQHGGGHSEGVNDDFYGHWLVPETIEGVKALISCTQTDEVNSKVGLTDLQFWR